ncbi:unnamed protein product, partial [Medioppia subpectinata]
MFYVLTCILLHIISVCLAINGPQFCDHNYVDTILWDGLSYRVTRNEWIAAYDPYERRVSTFYHKNLIDFPNKIDRGYYYQSGYHIPSVPADCQPRHSLTCEIMNKLIGLTVYTIRDTISGEIVHRVDRTTDSLRALPERNVLYFFDS